jgi:alpha-D-ribose 1-methylphosphonate 5-triphosphate synthase subunit PhnH
LIEVPAVFSPACRQRLFRRLLDATARPGTIAELSGPADGAPAWLAVLSVFVDRAVGFADPDGLLGERERAFLPARSEAPERAGWLLRDGRPPAPPGFTPELGTLEQPERGATLVLRVDAVGHGRPLLLAGPGIDGTRAVAVDGLEPSWLAARARWCAFFPRGVDLVLADRERVVVLPRTTRIEAG